MPKVVASPPPQPPDDWHDLLPGRALIPYVQALRFLGVSRPTLEAWLAAKVLPRPIRPIKGTGRLYFRRDELLAALKAL